MNSLLTKQRGRMADFQSLGLSVPCVKAKSLSDLHHRCQLSFHCRECLYNKTKTVMKSQVAALWCLFTSLIPKPVSASRVQLGGFGLLPGHTVDDAWCCNSGQPAYILAQAGDTCSSPSHLPFDGLGPPVCASL